RLYVFGRIMGGRCCRCLGRKQRIFNKNDGEFFAIAQPVIGLILGGKRAARARAGRSTPVHGVQTPIWRGGRQPSMMKNASDWTAFCGVQRGEGISAVLPCKDRRGSPLRPQTARSGRFLKPSGLFPAWRGTTSASAAASAVPPA